MSEPKDSKDSEALSALLTLAARLRDTASAVAERADAAAHGVVNRPTNTGDEGNTGSAEDSWASADFGAIVDFIRLLGETVPEDLKRRLDGSSREALLALRALIDWYLERDIPQAGAENPESSDPAS